MSFEMKKKKGSSGRGNLILDLLERDGLRQLARGHAELNELREGLREVVEELVLVTVEKMLAEY